MLMEKECDISDFKKSVAKLYASKAYNKLNHSIRQTDIFKILGVSRSEQCHSKFIAWLLDPNGSHGLGEFSLRRFLQLLAIKKNSRGLHVKKINMEPYRDSQEFLKMMGGNAFEEKINLTFNDKNV